MPTVIGGRRKASRRFYRFYPPLAITVAAIYRRRLNAERGAVRQVVTSIALRLGVITATAEEADARNRQKGNASRLGHIIINLQRELGRTWVLR